MHIRISGVVYDSIVDGPGLRTAVFVQGCSHGCPGCHNPHTHDPAGGRDADTADILAAMAQNPVCAGLTLTGGEPFEQPAPCLELAREVHALGKSVWAYSGYTLEALRAMENPDVDALLKETDVLVDGPYLETLRSLELKFRGSTNQRILDLKHAGPAGPACWKDPWDAL
ncbi:MAG: anaerobic ribonucleoside-triphosphate reductase activating protein [Clostridia bacterium]|nr:anaerobic ribonucleoside-triphosphate reductase activating protein [Clostridia bacterium]